MSKLRRWWLLMLVESMVKDPCAKSGGSLPTLEVRQNFESSLTFTFRDLGPHSSSTPSNFPASVFAMAPIDKCLASMARLSLSSASRPAIASVPKFLAPSIARQSRQASQALKRKETKKKRSLPKDFQRHKIVARNFPRWSLSEAMR